MSSAFEDGGGKEEWGAKLGAVGFRCCMGKWQYDQAVVGPAWISWSKVFAASLPFRGREGVCGVTNYEWEFQLLFAPPPRRPFASTGSTGENEVVSGRWPTHNLCALTSMIRSSPAFPPGPILVVPASLSHQSHYPWATGPVVTRLHSSLPTPCQLPPHQPTGLLFLSSTMGIPAFSHLFPIPRIYG